MFTTGKGQRYCELLTGLVKRVDILGFIGEDRMKGLCKEFSFVNHALGKAYNIIFKRGLSAKDAIHKLRHITDKDNKPFIDAESAKKLYAKFQQLNPNMTGGSTPVESGASKKSTITEKKDELVRRIKTNLTGSQKKMVDDTFDMMEVLLISLSLLPVAGWAFDFPLFVYSLTQRKYTLAMMTVLNWFIWGFWLMFGMNVNMGPTLKSSYLGNQENVVKKALLFPHKEPSKVLYPSTHVQVKEIDGTNYLVDANNNVYSSMIKSPRLEGVITSDSRFVQNGDPEYEEALQKRKEELKADKVGPGISFGGSKKSNDKV